MYHKFFFNNFFLPFKIFYTDRSLTLDITFFSTLLILLPIVLVTGPALPDIFLSLIAIFFLIKSIFLKNWKYYKNPIVVGFLLFSIYGVLRSLLYEIPAESLTREGSIFYFRYIFFAMGVWYLLDNNRHLSKCLLIVSIFTLLIVSTDGMYQYFTGFNFFGNEKWSDNRLTGFFGDEPIIGRYISYLSIFTFVLIYQNFEIKKKTILFSIAFMVITEVLVFLTGERSPLFSLTLFSILVVIFMPHLRFYRIIGFLFSILIIFTITQINPVAKKRMVDETFNQVSQTQLPFLPYSDHHEEHYISALKMFSDNPLFGIGTNTFSFECEKSNYKISDRSCTTHPHQFYIQVLAELGIFGFLFMFSFFVYLSWSLIKQFYFSLTNQSNKLIPFNLFLFHILIFVYWWPIIPHMSLYNNWNNVLIMLPLGYFLKAIYGEYNGKFTKI